MYYCLDKITAGYKNKREKLTGERFIWDYLFNEKNKMLINNEAQFYLLQENHTLQIC